jgi:hypothetical protein
MKLKFPWQKIQLINAAKELAELKLWEQFDNMDFFVVETPVEEPVVACLMGAGSEEYGVCVFRGPDAFKQPFLLSENEKALAEKGHTVGFSMVYYREMHPQIKKWFKGCNYRAKKDEWLPEFIVLRPGQYVEMPEKNRDIELLLYVIKGIVSSHRDGHFNPVTIGKTSSKMLTLQASGKAENPTVKVVEKSFPGSRELLELCHKNEVFDWAEKPDLSGLPVLDQTWVVATAYLSAGDDGDDVCIMAIAEEDSGYILHSDVIQMDPDRAIDLLLAAFFGDNASESRGVPKLLIIADELLFGLLGSPLNDLGIKTICDAEHPTAEEVREGLENELPGFIDSVLTDLPDIDLTVVPDDDDLDGWKAVAQVTANRLMHLWNHTDSLRQRRPCKKFFGDWDWEYYIEEFQELQSLGSYVVWAALCYRKRKKDAPYVEQLLADGPPAALGAMLEALSASYPSLYQIVETNPDDGTLVMKDLLLGGETTVHDTGLSETAQPNWIASFRVSKIGRFCFVDIAGPPFGPLHAMAVLDWLTNEKLPATPTPEWLRKNAYIFGRLWDLYDDITADPEPLPKLTNTDGNPLEMITAQFGYSDAKTVHKALKRRNDIDYDEAEDTFVWFKNDTGKKTMGMTLLGRIYFEDGLLKAEVNSAQRLDGVRELLEEAGAVYHTHESKNPAEAIKEVRSKPASLPISEDEIPEEVRKAIEEKLKTHYMDWLDMPIPRLDNKTPRQAAKTAKGAQRVKMLIETIPDAVGNAGGITAPKKVMLEELGLEGFD